MDMRLVRVERIIRELTIMQTLFEEGASHDASADCAEQALKEARALHQELSQGDA